MKPSTFSRWYAPLLYLSLFCLVIANHAHEIQDEHNFKDVSEELKTLRLRNYFRVDQNSIQELATVVDENVGIVNMVLNFTNIVWQDMYLTYFEEEAFSKYIDPLMFTLARPGLDYLLLSLPFDFVTSSIKGLAFAVTDVNINIEIIDEEYFFNLNDTMQLDLLFQLMEATVQDAGDLNRGSIGEFAVCLDHVEDRTGIYTALKSACAALLSNRHALIQSVHNCRLYEASSDNLPNGYYWFNELNLIFSVCISVFAPLAFLLFLPKNMPFQDKHGVIKMTLRSTRPTSFRYAVLSSYQDRKIVKLIRFAVGLVLLVSLSYIQPIVAYLYNTDDYTRRILALKRFDNTSHLAYLGTTIAYYIVLGLVSFMFVIQVLFSNKDGECWESDTSRCYLIGMKLSHETCVPKLDEPFTRSALLYAQFRMTMALDFRVWRDEYLRLLDWVTPKEQATFLAEAFKIASFIVLFIPYSFTLILRFVLNSLPILYITKQAIVCTERVPIGALFLAIAAPRFAPIIWYFINIFQLCLTAFVTNQFVVLPALATIFGLLMLARMVINRYHEECDVLTKDIFNEVYNLQELIHSNNPEELAKDITDDDTRELNDFDDFSIEVDLYYSIFNEIQNTHKRVALTASAFLISTSIGAISYQFLVYIDKLTPIGAAMFLISPLLITLVALPPIYNLISIDSSYDSSNKQHRARVRSLIKKYYKKEKIVSSICQRPGTVSEEKTTKSEDTGESNEGFANSETFELVVQ